MSDKHGQPRQDDLLRRCTDPSDFCVGHIQVSSHERSNNGNGAAYKWGHCHCHCCSKNEQDFLCCRPEAFRASSRIRFDLHGLFGPLCRLRVSSCQYLPIQGGRSRSHGDKARRMFFLCAPECWQTYLRVLPHVQRSNWKSGAGDSSTMEEGASGEWTWWA